MPNMPEIIFESDGSEPDAFNLYDNRVKIGEMIVEIAGKNLKVYHTEVDEDQAGKGYAKDLLNAMAAHCRLNNLSVIPLCTYVALQFERHPETYLDIWNRDIVPKF